MIIKKRENIKVKVSKSIYIVHQHKWSENREKKRGYLITKLWDF